MMHPPQSPNTPDDNNDNDALFDFNQIFIARERQLNEIMEKLRRDRDNQYDALRGASVEMVASAISTFVPGSKPIAENATVQKGADALLKLTGEQLGHIYQQVRNRLLQSCIRMSSPEKS